MTSIRRSIVSVALIGIGVGCTNRVDVEKVPIGTRVEVTREDGGVVRGTLTARDEDNLRVAVGPATRSIARDAIKTVELAGGPVAPPLPAVARFRELSVPDGTALAAQLNSSIGSDTSHVEDQVEATLTEAVRIDDVEVLPAGSILTGVVTTADPAGKVRGRASLGVRFEKITIADSHTTYAMSSRLQHTAAATKGDDAKKIGIPAAGGAIIGAIVGGKKGAGVGAVVGGGAGAAVTLATSGPEVRFVKGAALSLVLDQPIDVRVPIVR